MPNSNVITSASPGDVVKDRATVTRDPATPAIVPDPTGSITFHRFATINCTGASADETTPLLANLTATSSTFTVVGSMSYKANFTPDANSPYPASVGACEPLR